MYNFCFDSLNDEDVDQNEQINSTHLIQILKKTLNNQRIIGTPRTC